MINNNWKKGAEEKKKKKNLGSLRPVKFAPRCELCLLGVK
jgi:hypothetical protein